MRFTFLGTAADVIPAPFCDCSKCEYAREHSGKDERKRCCYLINDDLLVDMGPDLAVSCVKHKVNLLDVKHALVTHGHRDHFDAVNLASRKTGFKGRDEKPLMNFVAPPSVMTLLNLSGIKDSQSGIKRLPILPFDEVNLGDYKVKALKANHMHNVGDAVTYLIDDGMKKVLIASDTAVYEEEVWTHLEGLELDQLVIECTVGTNVDFKEGQTRHLSVNGVKEMIEKMRELGVVTDSTSICATHFTHQHCPNHEELSELLNEMGLDCAYDGLELTI